MGRTVKDLYSDKPRFLCGTPIRQWRPIDLPPPPPLDVKFSLALTRREAAILIGIGWLLGFVSGLFSAPWLHPAIHP